MSTLHIDIMGIISAFFITLIIIEYNPFDIPESVVNSLYQNHPEVSKQDINRLIKIYQSITSSNELGCSFDVNTDSRELSNRIFDTFFLVKRKADRERERLKAERQ